MTRVVSIIPGGALLAAIFTPASALTEVESFEDGIPTAYEAIGGKLTLSSEHIVDGRQALRWDFRKGDALVIRSGPLGNVGVWTGYGGYSRSALVLPIHLDELGPGHLTVEVRAGEETAASFEVPLAHVGWQQLVYHYSWNSRMTWHQGGLRGKLDNFRITAHGTEGKGHAWFDAIRYNVPRDFRDAREAVKESWQPADHDFSDRPPPDAGDLQKLETLARSLVPAPAPGTDPAHWQRRLTRIGEQITHDGLSKGHPVRKGLSHYFGFLNGIADDWCRCTDAELRPQFAARFVEVNDWLREQGLVVNGALGKADNYVGRLYVDAATKMRDPLAAHGALDRTLAYLKWAYEYDEQVFGNRHQESMDYFHNEALRLLRIALAHPDPVTRWHHVERFRDTLGRQLVASIKPDGSIYHHGFHYFAYGSMGMNSVSGTLAAMSAADLPVSKDGLDTVRTALEAMSWYSGRTTLWSLSGRNPSGTQNVPAGAFASLARAYAPYLDGKPDPILLAGCLRFEPGRAKDGAFQGIRPADAPGGHRTMPFAALGMQRRDHWLAGVKGYSRHVASGESYANANRHGLFLSMGQLELLTHPKPLPTVHGSGTRPNEGYNWFAIDGTTTVHGTLAGIANGNGTRIPRSGQAFVGGLSDGRDGLFVLTFENGWTDAIMRDRPADAPKPEPLRALKSWFFFDNRIVCLGSDISTKHVTYPVRTTLFQKFLSEEFPSATLNGETLAPAGDEVVRELTSAATLLDPYGNAYFTPEGTPVHLRLGEQLSRDGNDGKDTTGTYATAWIEHGVDPHGASYEYAVLVQPEASQVAAFATAPPYTVLRRDARAHIVRDHATRSTGYVVFDPTVSLPEDGALMAVDQPCLAMLRPEGAGLRLTLTDPDLRPEATEAAPVVARLRGRWRADLLPPGVSVTTNSGTTTVRVPVLHGESVSLVLVPADN